MLEYIASKEIEKTQRPVLILLHGYGSNEFDMPKPFSNIVKGLDSVSFRAPHALEGGGFAWANLPGNVEDLLKHRDAYRAEVQNASEQLIDSIDKILPKGIHIVPIGFSQGAMMVSQLIRNIPERIDAAVMCSGLIQDSAQPKDQKIGDLPIFIAYGDEEDVIPQPVIDETIKFFKEHSRAEYHMYNGMDHTIDLEEVEDIQKFLLAHIN